MIKNVVPFKTTFLSLVTPSPQLIKPSASEYCCWRCSFLLIPNFRNVVFNVELGCYILMLFMLILFGIPFNVHIRGWFTQVYVKLFFLLEFYRFFSFYVEYFISFNFLFLLMIVECCGFLFSSRLGSTLEIS